MKKLIYILSLLFIGFTSCNEDFNEGISPQSNPQEGAQSFEGLTLKLGSNFNNALSLANFAVTDTLKAIEATASPELNAKSKIEYTLEISKTADFAKVAEMDAGTGSQLKVADLNTAFRTIFGNSPAQKDVYVRCKAYIVEGTSRIQYGDYFNFGSTKVTPIPLDVTIDEAYSLVKNAGSSWDVANMTVFNHSSENVYDDPIFTLTFQTTANNTMIKFVPKSLLSQVQNNVWTGVVGAKTDGTTDLTGDLTTSNSGSIVIATAQWVKVTLNMMTSKYTVELLGQISPYLWTPGAHQSWTPATSTKLYSANMDLIYTGFSYLTGEFKLTSAPDWAHTNYGTANGKLDTGGGNLSVASAGFYFIKANLNDMSYSVVATNWGLIGAATAGGWDTSTAMTYNQADNSWNVTTNLTAGEFKFRANDGWEINVGGTTDHLTQNGSNLSVSAAGNYTVKLYLINDETSYCTVTKN